jgi:hypothetical protein
VTLRLLWPQWQGAGTSSVQALAPEFPFHVARRGYAVGSTLLAAVLPANQGPTAAAPVAMDDTGLELADGIDRRLRRDRAAGQGGIARDVTRTPQEEGAEDEHPHWEDEDEYRVEGRASSKNAPTT